MKAARRERQAARGGRHVAGGAGGKRERWREVLATAQRAAGREPKAWRATRPKTPAARGWRETPI